MAVSSLCHPCPDWVTGHPPIGLQGLLQCQQGIHGCGRPGQHQIVFNPWWHSLLPKGSTGMHMNSELRLCKGPEVRNYISISPNSMGSNLCRHMHGPKAIWVAVACGRQSTWYHLSPFVGEFGWLWSICTAHRRTPEAVLSFTYWAAQGQLVVSVESWASSDGWQGGTGMRRWQGQDYCSPLRAVGIPEWEKNGQHIAKNYTLKSKAIQSFPTSGFSPAVRFQ